MRSIVFAWLAAILQAVAVVPSSTAQEKQDAKQIDSALVVAFEKEKVSKVYRLTDEKQLAALEAFFPNYRSRPPGRGNAWFPDYEVYLNLPEGETVRLEVTLQRTPPLWRAFGRGDHELKGDFRKFVSGLKPGGAWEGIGREAESKQLSAEREVLRRRLEEIEKRLTELDNAKPIFVRISEPYEVVQGEPGGPNVGLGNKATMRRDKFAYLLAHLNTLGDQNKPVPAFKARHIFQTQPFRFEVEFPHEDAKQPPVRVQGSAKPEDCEGNEMAGFVRVPKEARLGEVEIKVSWPAFQQITQGSTTMKVFVLPVKE